MKRLTPIIAALALLIALPAGVASAKSPLRAETTHVLAVPPVMDGVWMLAWTGTVSGDIEGTIEWWIDTTTWTAALKPDSPAKASHYVMKTVVRCGGDVILETLERGTTTMANQTWRANGSVIYADPVLFPGWQGRQVHESGEFQTATFPWTGSSTFRVN